MASTRVALSGKLGWIHVAICWAFLLHDLIDRVTSASDPSIFYALGSIGLGILAAFIACLSASSDPHVTRVIGSIIAASLAVLSMFPADNMRFLLLWYLTVMLSRSDINTMKRGETRISNNDTCKRVFPVILAVVLFYLQWKVDLTVPAIRLFVTAIPAVTFILFWRPAGSTTESEESQHDIPVFAKPGATFCLSILWGCMFTLPFAIARVLAGHFKNTTFILPVIVAGIAAGMLLASACVARLAHSRPRSRGALWGFTISLPALIGVPWIMATSGIMIDSVAAYFHVGTLALVPLAFSFMDDARVLITSRSSQKTMLAMIVGASLGIVAGIAGILFGAENYLVDPTIAIAFTTIFLLGSIWTSAVIDSRKP